MECSLNLAQLNSRLVVQFSAVLQVSRIRDVFAFTTRHWPLAVAAALAVADAANASATMIVQWPNIQCGGLTSMVSAIM